MSKRKLAPFDGSIYGNLASLMREANDGNDEALRKLGDLAKTLTHSRGPLDADAVVAELLDLSRLVSPATRYAIALWIDGKLTKKRGRKAATATRNDSGPRLESLDPNLCTRVLLDFGSTSEPKELHATVRRQLADLLNGTRMLTDGTRTAPPQTLRTKLAAHNVGIYVAEGATTRKAIKRAADEAGVKFGTLQRDIYPRAK